MSAVVNQKYFQHKMLTINYKYVGGEKIDIIFIWGNGKAYTTKALVAFAMNAFSKSVDEIKDSLYLACYLL